MSNDTILRSLPILEPLVNEWSTCQRCPLGVSAKHHVLFEIVVPAQPPLAELPPNTTATTSAPTTPVYGVHADLKPPFMFIGEGPGVGENVLGRPFVGPAGQLLRECIAATGNTAPYTLTNLLACRPWALRPSHPANRAPDHNEIEACAPRLTELVRLLQPRIIIVTGKVPLDYAPNIAQRSGHTFRLRAVRHPSWVVRQLDKDAATQQYIEDLREAMAPGPMPPAALPKGSQ